MELSYLDLLIKLKEDVQSDIMPEEEKSEILKAIHSLEMMLWKYSA